MTDKQIIIDGVDVSGCEFYLPHSKKCECIVDDNGNNNIFCREYRDCYYKRMYHTGQEKDIYKNENKELYKQLKAKEQECCSYIDKYFLESNKVLKLKKTLQEIKEIIYFNKANRMAGGACISIEQILQKISEVEYG